MIRLQIVTLRSVCNLVCYSEAYNHAIYKHTIYMCCHVGSSVEYNECITGGRNNVKSVEGSQYKEPNTKRANLHTTYHYTTLRGNSTVVQAV
jgi:hypothetical protein